MWRRRRSAFPRCLSFSMTPGDFGVCPAGDGLLGCEPQCLDPFVVRVDGRRCCECQVHVGPPAVRRLRPRCRGCSLPVRAQRFFVRCFRDTRPRSFAMFFDAGLRRALERLRRCASHVSGVHGRDAMKQRERSPPSSARPPSSRCTARSAAHTERSSSSLMRAKISRRHFAFSSTLPLRVAPPASCGALATDNVRSRRSSCFAARSLRIRRVPRPVRSARVSVRATRFAMIATDRWYSAIGRLRVRHAWSLFAYAVADSARSAAPSAVRPCARSVLVSRSCAACSARSALEERSDETPRARASGAKPAPDPIAKPKRRHIYWLSFGLGRAARRRDTFVVVLASPRLRESAGPRAARLCAFLRSARPLWFRVLWSSLHCAQRVRPASASFTSASGQSTHLPSRFRCSRLKRLRALFNSSRLSTSQPSSPMTLATSLSIVLRPRVISGALLGLQRSHQPGVVRDIEAVCFEQCQHSYAQRRFGLPGCRASSFGDSLQTHQSALGPDQLRDHCVDFRCVACARADLDTVAHELLQHPQAYRQLSFACATVSCRGESLGTCERALGTRQLRYHGVDCWRVVAPGPLSANMTETVRRARRPYLAGANPARQLSLQPVAVGAAEGGNDLG